MTENRKREWFLDYWLPLTSAIIIHLLSCIFDFFYGKDLFQRSGAVIVLGAIMLESQAVVRLNNTYSYGLKHLQKSDTLILQHLGIVVKKLSKDASRDDISKYNDIKNSLAIESQKMIDESHTSFNEMVRISKLSLILALYGTAIWAYGDIVFCFIKGTLNEL